MNYIKFNPLSYSETKKNGYHNILLYKHYKKRVNKTSKRNYDEVQIHESKELFNGHINDHISWLIP